MRKDTTDAAGKNADIYQHTESGFRDIKNFPERLANARGDTEELCGSFETVNLNMVDSDLLTISDFLNDATAATFALQLGTLSNTQTKTIQASSKETLREIVKAV